MPKFHGEKAGAKSTPSKVIRYVLNEEKTLVYDTIGLSDEEPYSKQFRQTAALKGSKYDYDERKYYHYKMTFEEKDWDKNGGEITPEKALEMGKKFCDENFPGYEAVLSVHGDTKNIHVHIVLNAFSYNPEQNKIHINDNEYATLKDNAFELGKEYGLEEKFWREEVEEKRERQRHERQIQPSTEPINLSEGEKEIIDKYKQVREEYEAAKVKYEIAVNDVERIGEDRLKEIENEYQKCEKRYRSFQQDKYFSDYSFKEKYRIAIREAKEATTNLETFAGYLKEHFNIDTQITNQGNIKYKLPDRKTYSSGKALGSDYELEAIEKALEETKNKPSDLPKEPNVTEIQALEWHRKFDEEYAKFQKWQEEDYKKQREEWRRKEKEGDASAEYFRNKLLLENSAELYRLCEQVRENEILAASLTKKEEAQLRELEEKKNELERQQQQAQLKAIHGVSSQAYNPERERVLEMREHKRQEYIDTLKTAGTSLADRIKAAQGIREMNIEEGKTSREQELYNIKDATLRRRPIYAKRDWEVQRQIDSVRIARELGANTSAELELKVKQEGREYGKIKREYTAAKKQYDEAVNAASVEISKDTSLSVEDRIKKLEEVKSVEYEKIRGISEKFHEAKDHYRDCARALETVDKLQAKQISYSTPEQDQEEAKEETPRRSKTEAEKERKQQWAELREWSDKATQAVSSQPFTSKEADLQLWAKEMEKHGATVRITANTISLKHPNSNQAVRTNRLGGAYEREEILNDISIQRKAENDSHDSRNDNDANERADSKRKVASDERGKETGVGKQPAQGSIERVQSEIRGIERKVAKTAFGNRTEQPEPKSNDRPKAQQPTNDQQQVRRSSKRKTRRDRD